MWLTLNKEKDLMEYSSGIWSPPAILDALETGTFFLAGAMQVKVVSLVSTT